MGGYDSSYTNLVAINKNTKSIQKLEDKIVELERKLKKLEKECNTNGRTNK